MSSLRPSNLVAALLLAAALAVGAPARAETTFPTDLFGGPFALTAGDGRTVRDTDFPDRYLLIYFGYTFCPDICPGDLSRLAVALDALPPAVLDRVQPLFVTVDPERDSPEDVASYAKAFHPKLIGLSGSREAVKQAVDAYRVHRAKVFVPGEPKDDYLISHSPNIYLMAPNGDFLSIFPHDSRPEGMADAIRRYVEAG